MKKLYTIIIALLLTTSIIAQSPEKMSYQAVIRNSSDELVINQTVGVQISILQGTADGTPVYVETQTPTTNANGLVSIEIGGNNATVVSGDFTTIDWANSIYFLKTETDPTGGTSYTITGTSQLLSVPYALHAKTAESITGTITETDPEFTNWDKSYNDLTNTPNIIDSINTVIDTTTQFVRTELDGDANNEIQTISRTGLTVTLSNEGGTYQDSVNTQNLVSVLTQNNDGGAIQIKNIADPTDSQDAATKAYVDILKGMILDMQAESGVTDIDGNTYKAVRVGNQVWMAENLKVTKENDGTALQLVTDNTVWGNLTGDDTDKAYCYYNNNASGEADIYGAIYTYAAAKNVCPTGWHLPKYSDWEELIEYITADGHSGVEGTALKSTTGWNNDGNGNDDYSFKAMPGGMRNQNNGIFEEEGNYAKFWGDYEIDIACLLYMTCWGSVVDFQFYAGNMQSQGNYVRCVKDK